MILVHVRNIFTTAHYNSTQKDICDIYRHTYKQFLEQISIKNDLNRSSYTNQLQSFFSNNVVMSCTWYAIFVTENYEKWITRIIMYSWHTIHIYHNIYILINIWWIINNYKSYQKNHLINAYSHDDIQSYKFIHVSTYSSTFYVLFCKNTTYYWWKLYIWEIYLEQYMTTAP